MNNFKLLFRIFILLLVCTASAFSQTGNLGSTIRLRLPAGASFTQVMETYSEVVQDIGGMKNTINTANQMEMLWQVKDVDDRGNMRVDITYQRIQSSMDDPISGETILYDSNNPTTTNPMAMGYEVLIGKTVSMTISPTGELSNLEGWKAIQDEMVKGLGDVPEITKEQLKAQLSEESLFDGFKTLSGPYSSGPVSVGDSWTTDDQMSFMNIEMNASTTFRLTEATETEYILDLSGKISSKPGGSQIQMMGMDMTIETNGPQSGKLGLDRKTGFITRGTIENTMNQKIDMGQMGKIDQVVKTKVLFNIK